MWGSGVPGIIWLRQILQNPSSRQGQGRCAHLAFASSSPFSAPFSPVSPPFPAPPLPAHAHQNLGKEKRKNKGSARDSDENKKLETISVLLVVLLALQRLKLLVNVIHALLLHLHRDPELYLV